MTPIRTAPDLAEFAALAVRRLRDRGPVDADRHVCALADSAAEFLCAYRRRTGRIEDVAGKLAALVIAAYVTAEVLGINLDTAWQAEAAQILSRGGGLRGFCACPAR